MTKNTNPSSSTPESRNPYGIGHIATRCTVPNHNHDISPDAVQVSPSLSYQHSTQPVTTRPGTDGQMYRIFGTVNYWPATGHMHITQRAGAMQTEISSLLATAERPKQDPASWPVHPCDPAVRRIALYRPVDEHYLAEAEAAMFNNLVSVEQTAALTSWAEGMTNV